MKVLPEAVRASGAPGSCCGSGVGPCEGDCCGDSRGVWKLSALLDVCAAVGAASLGLAMVPWPADSLVPCCCRAGRAVSSATRPSTAECRTEVCTDVVSACWSSSLEVWFRSCQLNSGNSDLYATGCQEPRIASCECQLHLRQEDGNLRSIGVHCLSLIIARSLRREQAWQLWCHAVREPAVLRSSARHLPIKTI